MPSSAVSLYKQLYFQKEEKEGGEGGGGEEDPFTFVNDKRSRDVNLCVCVFCCAARQQYAKAPTIESFITHTLAHNGNITLHWHEAAAAAKCRLSSKLLGG